MRINILGQIDIIHTDGRAVRAKLPKKAKALLAYLAIAGQPVPRERLADLLWPYQGHEQARHSLRNCLLEVRKGLGQADRDGLRTDFMTCWFEAETDLQAFLNLVASGSYANLGQAVALVRGVLLDGLDVQSEPWSEWLEGERERFDRTLIQTLTKYSEDSTAAGLHDEAIAAAARLVAVDDLNEPSHRRLMQALAAGGRRSSALHHFRKLQRILKDELAVVPDPATKALADDIARDTAQDAEASSSAPTPVIRIVPTPAPPPPTPGMTGRWRKLGAVVNDWLAGAGKLNRPLLEEIGAALVGAADLAEEQTATIGEQRATIGELRAVLAAAEGGAMLLEFDTPAVSVAA